MVVVPPQAPVDGNYHRLASTLHKCGVHFSPIEFDDIAPNFGSSWTTCEIVEEDGLFNVLGSIHPSHYVNDAAYTQVTHHRLVDSRTNTGTTTFYYLLIL
ncbi:hypothetical protein CDL15_Pgr009230 [Punica granatum]|uniref:Uncharacterized protein n=1 Tax=Punica granatum TaxID=22663 RepID=A0A218WV42_PUNGR|nr:hypothetical protein CDL15_Pgr009230 [Punica granatum]